jgi:hypothetical protein
MLTIRYFLSDISGCGRLHPWNPHRCCYALCSGEILVKFYSWILVTHDHLISCGWWFGKRVKTWSPLGSGLWKCLVVMIRAVHSRFGKTSSVMRELRLLFISTVLLFINKSPALSRFGCLFFETVNEQPWSWYTIKVQMDVDLRCIGYVL